jgi:dipeptidyl aminopeptidase/acylaminoacyl peptidase
VKSLYLACAATIAVSAGAQPLGARPLAVSDVNNVREVSDAAVDPTGTWVAYEVASVDPKADKSVTHLWMTSWNGDRTVQLTNREKESETNPRWSPDGRYLAFISSRGDKHDNDQLWLLDRTGGEAKPLTKLDGSVIDFAWAPGSHELALIVLDPDPDADKDDDKAKGDDDKPPKPIVIDRFQFKRDIDGYLANRRQRLMLFDVATQKMRRLTTGDNDEYLPAWSPDGSRIAFVSNRDPDPDRTYNYDVWVAAAHAEAQAPTRLTTFAGYDNEPDASSYPAWSPDGRSIAYLEGGPVELFSYGTRHLAVIPATGGQRRLLTAGLDRNVSQPIWSPDGKSLRFLVEDDKTQWLGSVSAAGGPIKRIAGDRHVLQSLDQQSKGKIAAIVDDPAHPAEVYAVDGTTLRRLSHQNDAWLADVQLAPVEDTVMRSRDGTEVHGFLLRPLNGVAGTRAPTILRLHGGPQSQFDNGFSFEWQLLAANGYAVVADNPRGGTGRGQDYAKALYADWGGVAVPDVLSAVDDAVARGIADPNRLGVGGWSYGGMLTNYVIASDPRFKAATSGASISNIFAGYGTDQYIRDYEMELGKPWEKPDLWLKNSYPFFHVDKIVTPTLFLGGDKDFNVPLLNGEQMYQALKSRGVPTELIIYPGQFHGLTRPSFLRDRYQRYLDWYGKYLK